MNIDFHTHGKLSKKVPFSLATFTEALNEAKAAGLHAIALTEHFNAQYFSETYNSLDKHFTYHHHYYVVNGIKVFPGVEVDAKDGGHFLFIGTRDDISNFWIALQPHRTPETFLPAEDLLDMAAAYPFLKIGAHPFRRSNPLTQHKDSVFQRLDALDLNGKDLYTLGRKMKDKLTVFAYQKELPLLAGSDTHHHFQYGAVYNVFFKSCETIADLKESIAEGSYDLYLSPHLEVQVKGANALKKLLKPLALEEK